MGLPLYSEGTQQPPEEDSAVLSGFAAGLSSGRSAAFGIEGPVLMVDGDVPAALRIDPRTVLHRRDLPDDVAWARPQVAEALVAAGYLLCDETTLYATPVAIQALALTFSEWDLWGFDIDDAFTALRAAAVGEAWDPVLAKITFDPGSAP
ncbi:MAG: hypothetical protein ABIS47_07555 [Acidimicrobiales bacterium]